MKKKYLIIPIFSLFIGFIIGTISIYFLNQIIGPADSDTEFVRACGELNGKKFTFDSIQPLNGSCFVSIDTYGLTVEPCRERHVNNYLNNLNSGKETKGFDVSQGPLDGSWRCSLTYIEKDSTIRAVPYYMYD